MRLALVMGMGLAGCLGGPMAEGWAPATATGGPTVIYDPLARPLPEIPLPNDAATRLDPTTATGRRLNVSEQAARTDHERHAREQFNQMDGFSTWLPLTVRFDAPLDVVALAALHANGDFRDDAIFLLNVDPDCRRFGEEVGLDIGRGVFPVTVYDHAARRSIDGAPGGYVIDWGGNTLFPYDEHGADNQRLFQETNEDADGDGQLDAGEDVDQDGVLDVANLDDPSACDGFEVATLEFDRCVADHLLTFYERQTHTLILKPLWPLEQRCTYAVVLSNRLVGEDGLPVQSPFPAVNQRDQTQDLAHATGLLSRYGLGLEDVAFAWTFTTGSMTADLEALRAGLYGSGPFAALAEEFPVSSLRYWTRAEMAAAFGQQAPAGHEEDAWLPGACAGAAITQLWNTGLGEWSANMCAVEADLSSVATFFGGEFLAPDLMVDKEGVATPKYPSTQNEVWRIDPEAGTATWGSTTVTLWCALPYEDPAADCAEGNPEGIPFCKPFPTVLYSHGYGGSRGEISLHMGRHTAMGFAACSLDAYGHGLNVWLDDPLAAGALATQMGAFNALGVPDLPGLMAFGRDRDLNNDGVADPGMDQWTADIFHTRDMVRQSALEITQLVRILRSMDGVHTAGDGRLLGDVDGDGIVDWGGALNTVGHWGISLGGVISGVVTGSEPGLDATSPNAGGAGLTDVSIRSSQPGVPEAVLLPMMGPVVVGCLPTDGMDHPVPVGQAGGSDCLFGDGTAEAWLGGALRLAMYAQDLARLEVREFGVVEGVLPGDRVCLENLRNGGRQCRRVNERGWLRLGVAADALDAIERRSALGLPDDWSTPFDLADPERFADALALTVYVGETDVVREVVDTFEREIELQGSRYPAGSSLVALQEGYGYDRNTPDFRRLLGFAQAALGAADPAVWLPHARIEPLDVPYDPHRRGGNTRALVMPTAGDNNVPVSTGIHMGRVSGLFGSWVRDEARFGPEVGWREYFAPVPRLGMSADDWLVSSWTIEGDARLVRFPDNPVNQQVIFDPDNVSDGSAAFSCGPSDWSAIVGENRCPQDIQGQEVFFPVPHPAEGQELRLDLRRSDGSYDAFRVPLLRPAGQHGIYNAQSFRVFDADAFMVDFTVRFLGSRGHRVDHEPACDCSASAIGNFTLDAEPYFAGIGRQCTEDDLKVCPPACAEGWGIRTPEVAACVP